ncbi:hypothetical protein [Amycolatopsis anabasis]|uniref:hypothetical protein n=1 Tax=Amycolatopsis anabasis TaxID=1840409 RepID=UPI00131E03F2|nr:hypothetical protein [Amycolatopsis anabasis]
MTLRLHVLARLDHLTTELAEQRAELARGPYGDQDSTRVGVLAPALHAMTFVREVMNAFLPGIDEQTEKLIGMAAVGHPDVRELDREEREEVARTGADLLRDIFADALVQRRRERCGW